jgi:hypothetical protein
VIRKKVADIEDSGVNVKPRWCGVREKCDRFCRSFLLLWDQNKRVEVQRQFTHTSGESCIRAILLFEQHLLLLITGPHSCDYVDVQIYSATIDLTLCSNPIDLDSNSHGPKRKSKQDVGDREVSCAKREA